jgi:hypothetical protein
VGIPKSTHFIHPGWKSLIISSSPLLFGTVRIPLGSFRFWSLRSTWMSG